MIAFNSAVYFGYKTQCKGTTNLHFYMFSGRCVSFYFILYILYRRFLIIRGRPVSQYRPEFSSQTHLHQHVHKLSIFEGSVEPTTNSTVTKQKQITSIIVKFK